MRMEKEEKSEKEEERKKWRLAFWST